MAKKQTRRSVSIRGTTYERIRSYCELEGISMSEFVEQRIAAFFDGGKQASAPERERAVADRVEPKPEARRPVEAARPAPRREPVAPPREPRRSQRVAPRPAPPAKARVIAERAGGKQKLDFEEMQDAARFFTF